jgi:hypothetical protein
MPRRGTCREFSGCRGLEIPFTGSLHAHDEGWFLAALPRHLDIMVTLIPGTTAGCRSDPGFGLASTDHGGRRAALELARQAAAAVRRMNQALGRRAVVAVELHSAPLALPGRSSPECLRESLVECGSWEWDGAALLVEHCDALVGRQPVAKGFLRLEDELEAVRDANEGSASPLGITLNWGRSVIETRAPQGAVRHIEQARASGLLAGVVFSGCAAVKTGFGAAWADVHVPPARPRGADAPTGAPSNLLEPRSLMTESRIRDAITAAGTTPGIFGVKVAARAGASVDERIATVAESLAVVSGAAAAVRRQDTSIRIWPGPTAACP